CHSFNQPLDWDTSNVKDMNFMFCECSAFNQPLDWDTTNVENMEYMFWNCKELEYEMNFKMPYNKTKNMFHGCILLSNEEEDNETKHSKEWFNDQKEIDEIPLLKFKIIENDDDDEN
ncbi:BspA family leucine-rich repeat surface protein, partial [Metamycoplasma cloacale]